MGRYLIYVGIVFIILGLIVLAAEKFGFLGKFPGDIYIKRDNFSFYFPVVSTLVLSVIISLILYLISRFK